MYYPILRARRNELLALREVSSKISLTGGIIPILEPVQASKSSLGDLYRCIKKLDDQNIEMIVIVNPKCKGQLDYDYKSMANIVAYINKNFKNVSLGYWLNDKSTKLELNEFIANNNLDFYVLHQSEYQHIKDLNSTLEKISNFKGHIIESNKITDEYRKQLTTFKISLKESFNKLKANRLYATCIDEFFSEDYQLFSGKGLGGFSDYSVVGGGDLVKGFTPNTIALHFVYENKEKNQIWIKHFLSKTYNENPDIGLMINETLSELKKFIDLKPEILNYSNATNLMLKILEKGDKTSAGNLKKLAIMHHLELMIDVLDAKNQKISEAS